MMEEILSSSRPPYFSGMSVAGSPISAAFLRSSCKRPRSLFSISRTRGTISCCMNTSAVWAIRWCWSVMSSGVKTSSGARCSMRKLPPLIMCFVSPMAIAPSFSGAGMRPQQPANRLSPAACSVAKKLRLSFKACPLRGGSRKATVRPRGAPERLR